MLILIAYATNSSGTYEVGKLIRNVAVEAGHDVRLLSVTDVTKKNIEEAKLVFFGSNTWDWVSKEGKTLEGQLPPHFLEFRQSLKGATFKGKLCAVYGLGDNSYTYVCASADHLKDFVDEIKGRLLGIPLKVEGYLFGMQEKDEGITQWTLSILKEVNI